MNFNFVIVGSDMNAYYMSRALYEKYGKRAIVVGRQETVFISNTKLFDIVLEPKLGDEQVFCKTLEKIALENKDTKLILVPCSDGFVKLVSDNREELGKYYLFNIPNKKIVDEFMVKENFYLNYKDMGIDFPKTETVLTKETLDYKLPIGLDYPLVIKASDVVSYYNEKGSNLSKVYKILNEEDLNKAFEEIRNSSYDGKLIIQEYIPGDDTALFDAVFYVSSKGQPWVSSFAQVVLQEHTKTAIGNTTAMINGYDENGFTDQVPNNIKAFLEKVGYQGFASIDIKYDHRDGKYKVLEINTRQGRGSYYLSYLGNNFAQLLVEDLIENIEKEYKLEDREILMSVLPTAIIKKYVSNQKVKSEALKLIKTKKMVNPIDYKGDMTLKRRIILSLRWVNYFRKYKNNNW